MPRRLKMLDQFYSGVKEMLVTDTKYESLVKESMNEGKEIQEARLREAYRAIDGGETTGSQEAKADKGKLRIGLVPTQIIRDIAEVREYGNKKYGSPDNWKNVEPYRYVDALLRHTLAFMDDPESVDEESGIPHYKHMACNMAFLCEMYKKEEDEEPEEKCTHSNVLPRCIEISNEILEESCLQCKYLKGQLITSTGENFYHCRLGDGLLKIEDVNRAARTSCNCFEEAANNV